MRNIFSHFLKINKKLILEKSLRNCHVEGLHSVVLNETEGRLTRVYFAVADEHNLWQNLSPTTNKLTLGFHPHHCDLYFLIVQGQIMNIEISIPLVTSIPLYRGPFLHVREYLYHSQITEGKKGFEYKSGGWKGYIDSTWYRKGQSFSMAASKMHTVGVAADESAIWLVDEGKENPRYEPLCYTNCDPNSYDTSKLYQPFETFEQIEQLFKNFDLI